MGGSKSTPQARVPTAAPPPLDEPWRKLSWGDNQMSLQSVRSYKPERENIRHLRVLLYGPVGAGKSSFISSVCSIIQGKILIPAGASATTSDKSHTKTFKTHTFKIGRGSSARDYPVVFNDVMGLEAPTDTGVQPKDIKLAMEGHLMEDYKFNPVSPLLEDNSDYRSIPAEDDKVHVLVCVYSANSAEVKDSVLQKMRSIRGTAKDLGIPQMAIITKIDEACPVTEKNLRNVYKSKYIQKKIKEFSAEVGIPMNCIFPVKNYSYEIDLDEDVDTLILSALRKIIDFGDDFIEKM